MGEILTTNIPCLIWTVFLNPVEHFDLLAINIFCGLLGHYEVEINFVKKYKFVDKY